MKQKVLLAVALAGLFGALVPTTQAATQSVFKFEPSRFDFYYVQGENPPTLQSGTYTNVSSQPVRFKQSVPNQPRWLNSGFETNLEFTAEPNSPWGTGALVDPTGLAVGTYSTALYLIGDFPGAPAILPITLTVSAPGSSIPSNQSHAEGTNISTSDGTVYRIIFGYRQPYTSAGAFLSYGYNRWEDVKTANAADLAIPVSTRTPGGIVNYLPPRDGALINDRGTVYIISNGYRQGFASEQVFRSLGYSFENVIPGDTSFMETQSIIASDQIFHPSGTVINDGGTICVVENPFRSDSGPSRRCFTTLADMNSWGIRTNEIIPANRYDQGLKITSTIPTRPPTGVNP